MAQVNWASENAKDSGFFFASYILLLMHRTIVKPDWFGFINSRKDLSSLLTTSHMHGGGFYARGGHEHPGGTNVILSRTALTDHTGCKSAMRSIFRMREYTVDMPFLMAQNLTGIIWRKARKFARLLMQDENLWNKFVRFGEDQTISVVPMRPLPSEQSHCRIVRPPKGFSVSVRLIPPCTLWYICGDIIDRWVTVSPHRKRFFYLLIEK